ncbi:hypothetical protein TNCV_2865721 [Trichonephila clavipes]|nr:hypothetical protein TNCV_2865721 [Trichonephila clavipes]
MFFGVQPPESGLDHCNLWPRYARIISALCVRSALPSYLPVCVRGNKKTSFQRTPYRSVPLAANSGCRRWGSVCILPLTTLSLKFSSREPCSLLIHCHDTPLRFLGHVSGFRWSYCIRKAFPDHLSYVIPRRLGVLYLIGGREYN